VQVTKVLSESILDNPDLGFYQLIYGTSLLVIVLVIIIKSQVYVRVSDSVTIFQTGASVLIHLMFPVNFVFSYIL